MMSIDPHSFFKIIIVIKNLNGIYLIDVVLQMQFNGANS